MSPSPLSPNVPHVLLQYISPPSQLTHPIPPHLLSKPLLQRHHFLHLTPEHPEEYICWPSSTDSVTRVLDLLEARGRPVDDDKPSHLPVQYSFDGEDFYAHVDLSGNSGEGPRLILQWDASGEWKYHNTDLMPFPLGSRPTLEDVIVPPPSTHPISLPSFSSTAYSHGYDVHDLHDDSDDDDYWNAYGSTDIGDTAYGEDAHTSAKDITSTEDAYWAQYASVQGTADSTIPSPIPPRRRNLQTDTERASDSPVPLPVPVRVQSEDTYAEPLPIPSSMLPPLMGASRWDPASPTVLAQLLSTISPRPSPSLDGSFDTEEEEELSSPTVGGSNESDLSSSPELGLEGPRVIVSLPDDGEELQLPMSAGVPDGTEIQNTDRTSNDEFEDDADLRVALEGVWRMWKKTRRRAIGVSEAGDRVAREVFLRTAQLVIQ